MNAVLRQLNRWRFRERIVRLAWGGGRWLAIAAAILALACLTDWCIDRYSGSQTWRSFLKSSWVFANVDPLSAGETPFWLRFLMTSGQLALSAGLVYYLLVRPWGRTPPIDELAGHAEKAYKEFDHRLVTALQLNRPNAQTLGMSKVLIGEVTREADEMAARHDLLKLIDYRRLLWAVLVVAPIALIWLLFVSINPTLAGILLQRQTLVASPEIPRRTHLENITEGVWPIGAEVLVRFKISGDSEPTDVGVLRIVPLDQPEEFYDLVHEPRFKLTDTALEELKNEGVPETVRAKLNKLKEMNSNEDKDRAKDDFVKLINTMLSGPESGQFQAIILEHSGTPSSYFITKLPPSSRDFSFQARLRGGRTKQTGEVRFEPPPQLAPDDEKKPPLTATLVLPRFLGVAPNGDRYTRKTESSSRGDVVDALPQSGVIIEARFNKPVARARLIPIERAEGVRERDLPPATDFELATDRLSASWGFSTTPKMIGYRIELMDDLNFNNPVPIRRNIRMWEDRPPYVEFKKESTRNPDPDDPDGKPLGSPDFLWDSPLTPNDRVMAIYHARSELGIREANIRYRVLPRGVQLDSYPEWYKNVNHPREDPGLRVYSRLGLTGTPSPDRKKMGEFVADLGLFRYSFRGLSELDRDKVEVGFYPFPSPQPDTEPGELEAGGRKNFEVSELKKMMPDGTFTKLDIGDTLEMYMEVFDKLPGPDGKPPLNRMAGYSREAKRKIVVSESDAAMAYLQRGEEKQKRTDKLREITQDQIDVYKEKRK
jgi:hypothetical protein